MLNFIQTILITEHYASIPDINIKYSVVKLDIYIFSLNDKATHLSPSKLLCYNNIILITLLDL